MKTPIFTFIIALMLLTGCSSSSYDTTIAPLLRQGIARGYPGFSIATETGGGKSLAIAAGKSDIENGQTLRADTPFHIGSITKILTAVAALRLVDDGKLSLESTLRSVLGDVVKNIPYADQITVAQLLDHSSGIYPTNNDLDYLSTLLGPTADPKRIYTPLELVALANGARQQPTGKPGEKHSYSDSNHTLLGLIVEKQSGMPFKIYVTDTILKPLGMSSTYFYSDLILGKVKPKRPMTRGYLIATEDIRNAIKINSIFPIVSDHKRPEGELFDTTLASERNDAAGGIISTLPDLLRLGSAAFRGKLLSPTSQTFLTAAKAGMQSQPIGKQRTWALQSMNKSYGVV